MTPTNPVVLGRAFALPRARHHAWADNVPGRDGHHSPAVAPKEQRWLQMFSKLDIWHIPEFIHESTRKIPVLGIREDSNEIPQRSYQWLP